MIVQIRLKSLWLDVACGICQLHHSKAKVAGTSGGYEIVYHRCPEHYGLVMREGEPAFLRPTSSKPEPPIDFAHQSTFYPKKYA